jgi:hypothetical protein
MMRWSPSTNSHLRQPAVSGGGGRWFINGAGSVDWVRCSLRCSVSSTGPWGSFSMLKERRRGSVGTVHDGSGVVADGGVVLSLTVDRQ